MPNGTHPAMDLGNNEAAFSDAELAQVQDIYQRVAEDYAPFDVDVTTEEPPAADIERTNVGDLVYGIRAMISPSTVALRRHLRRQLWRRRVHRRLQPLLGQGRLRRDPQSAPAGLGLPAGAGRRPEEHRRGDHPRGRPQPRPGPRRHQHRGLLRRRQFTPASGRRSWASATSTRSCSSHSATTRTPTSAARAPDRCRRTRTTSRRSTTFLRERQRNDRADEPGTSTGNAGRRARPARRTSPAARTSTTSRSVPAPAPSPSTRATRRQPEPRHRGAAGQRRPTP